MRRSSAWSPGLGGLQVHRDGVQIGRIRLVREVYAGASGLLDQRFNQKMHPLAALALLH